MPNKHNLVLYVDEELVRKSREFGLFSFNNKDSSKDSGLMEIESRDLPQVIRSA